jgi:hypothetical protein
VKIKSRVLTLLLAVCAATAVFFQWSRAASAQDAQKRLSADVSQALESFDSLKLDPVVALKGVRQTGTLELQTSHRKLELELEPYDVRADNWRGHVIGEGGVVTEMERTPSKTFRGVVRGEPGSVAALVLDGEKIEGVILIAGETYFIEPAKTFSSAAKAQDAVFYSASAVKEEAGECGVTLAEEVAAEAARAGLDIKTGQSTASANGEPTPEEAFAPRPILDLATEADFEYFQAFGSEAAAQFEINNIVAMVNGIYEAQMGITISVVRSRVWATVSDPYNATDGSGALNELRNVYNGSFAPGTTPARDLVHMWTGKDLDGSTIGIAFTGVICNAASSAYGISQKFDLSPHKVGLTAHEIGHNFSAGHPNQLNPPVSECVGTIMNSSITASTNFCQFSRDQITNHALAFGEACLARQTQPGCNFVLSTSTVTFGPQGGTASVGVSTGAGCAWDVAEGTSWLTVTGGAPATGPGQFTISITPNTGAGRTVIADIGGQRLTITQAGSPSACSPTLLNIGQITGGALTNEDCRAEQPDRTQAAMDRYAFAGRAGQRIFIGMDALIAPPNPGGLDTYLYLFGPDGAIIAENDDIVLGSQTNSRIPINGTFLLPSTGIYVIGATSYSNNEVGNYSLTLTDNKATNSVSFSSASYMVGEAPGADGIGSEGAGFVTVTVNRTGDLSGAAFVNYATATNGTADRRRDYQQAQGTLAFAPGQASKSFRVHVTDDLFAPGGMIGGVSVESVTETINLTLSNPVATTLGAQSSAVVTVVNNDTTPAQLSPVRWGPSFNTTYFVRQHYLDFFGREPDAGGLAFWSSVINECGDEPCREVRRINVSAAFFLSIEFQETGYLAYRAYKAAYGDATSSGVAGTVPIIRHAEFLADTARLGDGVVVGVGDWRNQLNANKAGYAEEFVITPRFLSAYPLTMTPEAFVDQLNTRSGGALSPSERNALVTQLANGQMTRAAVFLAVVEDATLAAAERNRAFVLMQFYGYMRRNPDDPQDTSFSGWKFWLDQLNRFNGDFEAAEMVKAFLLSIEYTERFGH